RAATRWGAADDKRQAVASGAAARADGSLRLPPRQRNRRVRRGPDRARPGARTDPVPRLALPPRGAQRHGPRRLPPPQPAARAAWAAPAGRGGADGLPLGAVTGAVTPLALP